MRVDKAVVPAAGLGTRMRSLAGDRPKELLEVGGKSLIARAVEGLAASGIREIAVVVRPAKEEIRTFLLKMYPDGVAGGAGRLVFVEQLRPSGVADAVSLCREFIGGEPFALVMPDNVLLEGSPVISQILPCFLRCGLDTIGALRLDAEQVRSFGNVGFLRVDVVPGETEGLYRVLEYSDKRREPVEFGSVPSMLKGFGCGVYLPHFFDIIEEWRPRLAGEVDEVPVLQTLARQGSLLAVELVGTGFDAGNPDGFYAGVRFATMRENAAARGRAMADATQG
jgi:UTP--glucose-1-phosphate uridylyltransferase